MREFKRDCVPKEYARALAQSDNELARIGQELVEADSDERGTIAALSCEYDEIADDGMSAYFQSDSLPALGLRVNYREIFRDLLYAIMGNSILMQLS